ncbi:MAG: tRNA (adenosine(37)-N6)-dimethylallyltransferase MiaA [Pseudomonadota bacterium]
MSDDPSLHPILIAGPTAAGKSALALQLAEKAGGEIINADAIQVYADLSILSARPNAVATAATAHHLFGHVDGGVRYSAGQWARDAERVLAEIASRRSRPIIVGGTGLYFKALVDGLSPMPDVPQQIISDATARHQRLGAEEFRKETIGLDRAAEKLPPGDTQRLIRTWSVYHATGEPLSAFQAAPRRPVLNGPYTKMVVEPERTGLYARCDDRFRSMVDAGAIDEVRTLLARGLDAGLPVMKTLGVPELSSFLMGDRTLDDAISLAQRNTRRFAKRQLTWFRGQCAGWRRVASFDEALSIVDV